MDEKSYSEPYLEAGPKNLCLAEENASSCTVKLATQLAEQDFEQLSESEQATWDEHVFTCSSCAGILRQHRKVQGVFRVLSSPERYPDEPELILPQHIVCELQAAGYHLEGQGDLVSNGITAPLASYQGGDQL
jgi:hypothetical protein